MRCDKAYDDISQMMQFYVTLNSLRNPNNSFLLATYGKLKFWRPEIFWANLMYLILRFLKFGYLRVPPIQIPTKKGLVKQISPYNKADGTFGNYNGVQKPGKIFRIWKFGILRVPSIQIPTKKG
jgi:hypothetical protein